MNRIWIILLIILIISCGISQEKAQENQKLIQGITKPYYENLKGLFNTAIQKVVTIQNRDSAFFEMSDNDSIYLYTQIRTCDSLADKVITDLKLLESSDTELVRLNVAYISNSRVLIKGPFLKVLNLYSSSLPHDDVLKESPKYLNQYKERLDYLNSLEDSIKTFSPQTK